MSYNLFAFRGKALRCSHVPMGHRGERKLTGVTFSKQIHPPPNVAQRRGCYTFQIFSA